MLEIMGKTGPHVLAFEGGPGPNEHLGGNDFGPGLLMNEQCKAIFEHHEKITGL